jgi:hypothetical protein
VSIAGERERLLPGVPARDREEAPEVGDRAVAAASDIGFDALPRRGVAGSVDREAALVVFDASVVPIDFAEEHFVGGAPAVRHASIGHACGHCLDFREAAVADDADQSAHGSYFWRAAAKLGERARIARSNTAS